MTVFLVILEDRHTDVEVSVFADRQGAIAEAKSIVESYEGEELELAGLPEEWLFHASLSCEGDSVRVEAADVYE